MRNLTNTLFLVLVCLFTVQGMRAKTSTYYFTNGVSPIWHFNTEVSVNDGYVSFTIASGGTVSVVSTSEFYIVKGVTINAKVEGTGVSVTFGSTSTTANITSDYSDVLLNTTDYLLNGVMTLSFSNTSGAAATVSLKSISVDWVQAGSISYAETSIEKTIGDADFTNELTHVGSGTVTYSSSEPAVATVDNDGLVTMVGVGVTVITATVADNSNYTYAEKTASYTLTVLADENASISYATTSVDKAYGDDPFTNALTNTGDGTVTYVSSVPTVATIDDSGEVTIVGVGDTEITATVENSVNYTYPTKTATYTLHVVDGTMTVTASGYNDVYDGEPHGISVVAPEGASVKYGTAKDAYTLDASPTYTDVGTYKVYYEVSKTYYTTIADSATVSITQAAGSISYTTTAVDKTYGDEPFTNMLTVVGDGTVTYSSSAPAVATVDENGVVTIAGVGDAEITATVADGTNYTYAETTATYTLHVAAQSMTVTATGYSGTYDGAAHGITVTAPEGAAVKYGIAEGTYDLEASPAYTDAGTYTVYYQATKTNYTTVTGSAAVTIAKAAASISYATTSIEKTYGEESFTNELTKSGDGTVTYASSAPAVATVDTATGLVSIVDAGETTITATVVDGANYAYATNTASYTLTVVRNNVVEPVVNDSTQADMTYETSFSENTEVQTTQLTNALIDNVLYTLNDQQTTGANDDGYDETRGLLVINSVVTSDEMEKVVEMQPGTKEFAEAYKGLTLMVPPGYGHLEIASYQESGYSLCVKIGQDEPVVLSHAEMRNDTIPFAVSQSAYVYIYLMQTGESHKSTTRGPKTHVSTGLNRMMIIADDIERVPQNLGYDRFLKRDHVKIVETRAASYCTVSDNGVNRIEEDLFGSLLSDKTNVMYIDLRSTSITGLTVDRSKGDFKGVPETTIIYLPAGNSSDEPNVVIGSVCKDLRLSNNGAEFLLPMDFMAVKATYKHNVGSGEVSTLYVPFNIDEPDTDGVFYELGGVANGSVAMTVVDKLKAHTPYAFRAGEEETYNLTADYAKLERAADSQTSGIMRGTYETVTADASGCYYGLTGDTKYMFKQLNNGDVIAPFSAYLYIESGLPQYGISWSDHWGEDVPPSGIKDVAADETDAAWYTLSGQKLSRKPTAKGLYIHKGKIIMNK